MDFFHFSHSIQKELIEMKRILRAVSALAACLILIWYVSPKVYRVLHLPDVVNADVLLSAPALVSQKTDAAYVRESGDERLHEAADRTVTMSLFGVIPLKSVSVSSHLRSVNLGGEAVGVILNTNGVQIVGFDRIDSENGAVCPALSAGLRAGDMICSVNGEQITDAKRFSALCESAEGTCTFSCLRSGEAFSVRITPQIDVNGIPRFGVWVRDSTSGIGTLSFYDSSTRAYAALGHGVTDVDTQALIAPATGYLTNAEILHVRKGDSGSAGELLGQFSVDRTNAIASVDRNTPFGISGFLTSFHDPDPRTAEIAPKSAAHVGDAYILSTVDETLRAYSVRVIRIDVQSSPETLGMMIEITDPVLLEKTGGIVQGMSGSPLMQDGKLIGVVTHVFLSQPTRGYCLYAESMADALFPAS